MANFKYVARDISGNRKEGLAQAISSGELIGSLRAQGLTPVSVKEVTEKIKKRRADNSRKRIKSSDLAAFCWQLQTMLEGGIPITIALETIAEDMDHPKLKMIVEDMLERVLKGETLSESMHEYPEVFNAMAFSLVYAGETSGHLPLSLKRLGSYYDNKDKIKRKVQGALAYPLFVVGFVVLIVVFIMTFIIPRFQVLFSMFDGELPAFTRNFMAFYEFMMANVIYILAGMLVFLVSCVLYFKTDKGHRFFSRVVLRVPLIGNLLRYAFVTTFSRTMATLVNSGVSILEIFEIVRTMSDNDVVQESVEKARKEIEEGENIADGLRSSEFFPNMLVRMMEVGENSGSISEVLEKTADYFERKVETTITTLTSLMEPILIISVGGIVLTVLIALYLPIFAYGT